jgi:hypothetical protein
VSNKADMRSYAEKLKDSRWKKRRAQILVRDGHECTWCGERNTVLHVHHLHYEPRREPWDYPDDMLLTVCGSCHAMHEGIRLALLRVLSAGGAGHYSRTLGYVTGVSLDQGETVRVARKFVDYEFILGFAQASGITWDEAEKRVDTIRDA